MAKKKGKPVSFDAMVKFFIQKYDIPTKKDFDRLLARLDQIEKFIKLSATSERYGLGGGSGAAPAEGRKASERLPLPASGLVLEIIREYPEGVGFKEIQIRTNFEEKKLRNIIFRLNSLNKIKRKERGIYVAV